MSQSTKIQGMTLTVSCRIPYTIDTGGTTPYEVYFQTPQWTVVGVLGSYSVTNSYASAAPNAATVITDLQDDLITKINDTTNTPIAQATAVMDVLQETLNSDTLQDTLEAIINVEHKAAYSLYQALDAQVSATGGLYTVVTAPTSPSSNQTASNIISSNVALAGAVSYTTLEGYMD